MIIFRKLNIGFKGSRVQGVNKQYYPLTLFKLCAFCLCAFVSFTCNAGGWVDDWIAGKTETSPGYFEGQKRGYYTGGSFNARWQTKNEYPLTVMAPRLKVGCGGIDAYMGGFSFMNAEYLVDKGQRILQAAPAAAFNIALNTLCTVCQTTLNTLESISNQLNSLQLDDCKAAKALVATVASPFTTSEKHKSDLSNIQADFMQSSGINDLHQSIVSTTKADNNKTQVDNKTLIAGCSADIKDVFSEGHVLNNIGVKMGFSTEYTDMMRGLIGDVDIFYADKTIVPIPVLPCEENNGFDIQNFVDGKIVKKGTDDKCVPTVDTTNLYTWAKDNMMYIKDKIADKSAVFTTAEEAFLNMNPLPASLILKTAIGTKQEDNLIYALSDITSKGYAYNMIKNIYYKIETVFQTANKLAIAQNSPDGGAAEHKCNIAVIEPAFSQLEKMRENLSLMKEQMEEGYTNSLKQSDTIFTFIKRMEDFDKKVRAAAAESTAYDSFLTGLNK